MAKFERVERLKDCGISMPIRKTAQSAGYDFEVAEKIIVPSIFKHLDKLKIQTLADKDFYTLTEVSAITKALNAKPTLVSTGMKCYLEPNTYLELSVRSSCPLKHWLVLANGVGIIDADYAFADNDGEIFFQLINLSPFDITLEKGDIIGQGIIKPYLTTENDIATGHRSGGFGSTNG